MVGAKQEYKVALAVYPDGEPLVVAGTDEFGASGLWVLRPDGFSAVELVSHGPGWAEVVVTGREPETQARLVAQDRATELSLQSPLSEIGPTARLSAGRERAELKLSRGEYPNCHDMTLPPNARGRLEVETLGPEELEKRWAEAQVRAPRP